MAENGNGNGIKHQILKAFIGSGPWALLSLLILGGLAYEINFFLREYVARTVSVMTELSASQSAQQRLAESNKQLLEHAVQVQGGMAEERREQTLLLRAIKAIVEERGAAVLPNQKE